MQPAPPDAHARDRIRLLLGSFAMDPTDPRVFAQLEEHLFLAGAWNELAEVYECRITAFPVGAPERAQLLLRMGEILDERLQAPRAAMRRYRELLARNPSQPEALARLRRIHTRLGELTAALQIAELEESLDLPTELRARTLGEAGRLWHELGEIGEARARFEEACRIAPGSDAGLAGLAALALEAGDLERATELHQRRVDALAGSARLDALEELAQLVIERDPDRARELLGEVVADDPERRTAIERLCALEGAGGSPARLDEMRELLWRVLDDPEERVQLALEAATAQLDAEGEVDRVVPWLDRARADDPDDARIHRLRVRVLRRAGRSIELIDALESLNRTEGPTAMGELEIAVLNERAGRPKRAVEFLSALLERDPHDGEALAVLDRCLTRLGRHSERVEVLERRIALAESDEEFSDLCLDLGDALAQSLDEDAAALDLYRRALSRTPAHAPALDRLKHLLHKTERFDELERLLIELAEGCDPGPAAGRPWCELGALRLERGRTEQAREAFARALELDPRNAQALHALHGVAARGAPPESPAQGELPQSAALALQVETARRAGQLDRARLAAEEWAACDPGPAAHRALAELARETGAAVAELRALEALAPLEPEPGPRAASLERLADLELELAGPGAPDRAARHLQAAVELDPSPRLRARLIDLYRRCGALEALAMELRTQLAADPNPEIRVELGRTLAELGDRSEAVAALRPVFDAQPARADVADLIEALLADDDRIEELCEVLGARLRRERDPGRRRELAYRQAGLLLEGLERPLDAVAALRELADPSRRAPLEDRFERALEASGSDSELETWLAARESLLEGAERAELGLRLAQLQHRSGRPGDAVTTLERARETAQGETRGRVLRALLSLRREGGDADAEAALLGELAEDVPEPARQAHLRLERARLLLSDPSRADEAVRELTDLQSQSALEIDDVEQVAALLEQADAPEAHRSALEQLVQRAGSPAARARALRRLSQALSTGPDSIRDPDRAEDALRGALEIEPEDSAGFEQLVALLEARGRSSELESLLRERVEGEAVAPPDRLNAALRLATALLDRDEPRDAAAVLASVRRLDAGTRVDELYYRALELDDNGAARIALCAERAEATRGPDRARWLQRWLAALEASGAAPEQQLPVVELLAAAQPVSPGTQARQLALLRELGPSEALAAALELTLEGTAQPASLRRAGVRELVRLYEGPLDAPQRALEVIERFAGEDRELRLQGAELAHGTGALEREIALLEPLLGAERGPDPEAERRSALARAARGEDAEPLLRRALERRPRDRDLIEALESVLRRSDSPAELAELLDRHFSLEPADGRARLAREGLSLAERAADDAAALRWMRRWQAIEGLPRNRIERWVQMEREHGDRRGHLLALATLRSQADDPDLRARACAEEAELHAAAGSLGLARERYEQAVELATHVADEWLAALGEVLERQGRPGEQAEVLARRIESPVCGASERSLLREARAELLLASPETRAEGTRELRRLVDEDRDAEAELSVRWLSRLLELDAEADRTASWCDTAEELLRRGSGSPSLEIARELARRLGETLGDRGRATRWWEHILEREPEDVESLRALCELLRHAGGEARRAELLERLASIPGSGDAGLWIDAAEARWRGLRDPGAALRAVDHALGSDGAPETEVATRTRALELRAELCRHLERVDEERADLEALIELAGDGAESARRWLRLAELEAERPDRRVAAERAAWCALERADEDTSIRANVRAVLSSLGSWESAAQLLRSEVTSSAPEERAALLRELARIELDELDHPDEGCAVLEELAQIDELDAEDGMRWARGLESQGQWSEALLRRRQALTALGDGARAEDWLELARGALEREGDVERAREACDEALQRGADRAEALALRARLGEAGGDPATAVEDLVAVAEAATDRVAAATALARAAELAGGQLGDETRAWALYRAALKRDASYVPALLGAGRVALDRREWSEAERMFGSAIPLIEAPGAEAQVGEAALQAARAASEQHRNAEAFRYLERSLEAAPERPESLDAMAALALRLGDWARARECLDARLRRDDLDPRERAERWVRLAQAQEGLEQSAEAAESLFRAIELRPADEVSRARSVDLLEKLGEHERAVEQIEAWIERAPPESRAGLSLRAARLEAEARSPGAARERLAHLVAERPDCFDAWLDLLRLTVEADGPEASLELAERIPLDSAPDAAQAAVRWLEARALLELDRETEAAERALQTLKGDRSNVEAARLLASNLGRVGEWRDPVTQLEAALDHGGMSPPVESELWEAVGRAYAGPLESIEQAERCYRRALDANPLRATAREALADITAFDPAAHAESVHLHRELLEGFPARPQSWRAIAHVAQHWQREPAVATAVAVLGALRENGAPLAPPGRPLLVQTGPAGDPVVRAATELLLALQESGGLPAGHGSGPGEPETLRSELSSIAGPAWSLDDAALLSTWGRPVEDGLLSGDGVSRRTRRRLSRALRGFSRGLLRELEPATWRSEILAQAAARSLGAQRFSIEEALLTLLELWPTTSHLDLRSGGRPAEAIQLCPPAQQLLLRIADPTLAALGL